MRIIEIDKFKKIKIDFEKNTNLIIIKQSNFISCIRKPTGNGGLSPLSAVLFRLGLFLEQVIKVC